MDNDISFPKMVPSDVQNTLRWLLQVEEFTALQTLLETLYKYLPQDHPEITDFMAMFLHKAKRYSEALAYAQKTVQFFPSVEARFNLAKCLYSAGFPVEAEKTMGEVALEKPEWLDPAIDHSVYVAALGNFDEAETKLRSLLSQVPPEDRNHQVLLFNLGWHEIRHGNFQKGLSMLGIGRKLRIWGAPSFPFHQPALEEGQDLAGKKILIVGEGGAGDEIINVRFASTLKERGALQVFFSTNQGLKNVFQRSALFDQVITHKEVPPSFDYWVPAMDLPRILQISAEQIPRDPYLRSDPQLASLWTQRIPPSRKLRVGIRWQGNALYEQDLMRSVPFEMMESLANIPGVELYSLQRDTGLEELSSSSRVTDLSPHLKSWEDTAAAIAELDLVISSCTSVPHLAAALGKPVWLFCPLNSYYIWTGPDNGRAWYPSVSLYRQEKFGTWAEPYERILKDLQKLVTDQGRAS